MTVDKKDRGPGVRVPPPLIFAVAIFFGLVLSLKWPVLIPAYHLFLRGVGVILLVVSFSLLALSLLRFRRARTAVEPWKPASTMIVSGVYRFSRNPIYIAFIFAQVGLGFVALNVWLVLTVIPAWWAVYFFAVRLEERYLKQRFGHEYDVYSKQVRRWL